MTDSSETVSQGRVIVTRILLLIVLAAIGPSVAASDEHSDGAAVETSHETHLPKGLHEVAIFAGVTNDRGTRVETWGAEYSYGFMDNYSVGVYFDRAGGDLRSSVLGLVFEANVVEGLIVMFGPGVEYLDEAHDEEGSERNFLARFGVGYSFHVGKRYTILPAVHADFVDGKVVWITGVDFGFRFGKTVH